MNFSQIEHYNILEEIGHGGMSTVFRAENTHNGQIVAIKLMRDKFRNNSKARDRFIQEAQMVISLNHPAIVPVYDYGEVNGRLYIVMQYMAGGSVREKLQDGPLPFTEVMSILEPITSALVVAHENNIIHRDVKPHNILLDENDNAYLSDFGVARLLDEESIEQTMTLVGTPEFIAPEQAVEGGLTPQTDIYQLGISTFFLLTGQMPFSGGSLQVMQKHLHEPLPSAEEINPYLTMGVDKVLQTATAKNPEKRFISAGDFFTALTQLTNESTRTEIFAPAWMATTTTDEFAYEETTQTEDAEVEFVDMEEKWNAKRPLLYASAIFMVLAGMMAFMQSDTMPDGAIVEADTNPVVEILPDVIEENDFVEELVEDVETAVTEFLPAADAPVVTNDTTVAITTEVVESDAGSVAVVTEPVNNPPAQDDDDNPPPVTNNDGNDNNSGGNNNNGDGRGSNNPPPPPPPNGDGGNGGRGGRGGNGGRGGGGN